MIPKFRAWDKEKNNFLNLDWDDYYIDMSTGEVYEIEERSAGYETYMHKRYLSQVILLQYTGLKDGEERDIYEGDIAVHDGKSGSLVSKPYGIPIKYGNGEIFIFSYIKCGLVARHISSFGDSMYDTPNCIIKGWEAIDAYQLWNLHRGFKIIGNIYENPELLEVSP